MRRTWIRWVAAAALLTACDSGGGGGVATDVQQQDTGGDAQAADAAGPDGASADTAGGDATGADVATDTAEPADVVVPVDTMVEDTASPDTMVEDTATQDTTVADTAVADTSEDTGEPPADFGFTLRVPQLHEIMCSMFGSPQEPQDELDVDHICTFAYGGEQGHIYVQATAVDCNSQGFPFPIYDVVGAWFSKAGKVTELDNPAYDYGGNHNNDFITVDRDGKRYKYYHSSFGWGFRKCQPMDCVQVYDAKTDALIEDGCTMDRTIPVICVMVDDQGAYPDLVDTFAPCDGDPNYP